MALEDRTPNFYSFDEETEETPEQETFPYTIEHFEFGNNVVGKEIFKATLDIDSFAIQKIIEKDFFNRNEYERSCYEEKLLLAVKIEGIEGVLLAVTENSDEYRSRFGGWIHIKNLEPVSTESLGKITKTHLEKEKWENGTKQYSQIRTQNGTVVEFGVLKSDDDYPRGFAEIQPSLVHEKEERTEEEGLYDVSNFVLTNDFVGKELFEVKGIDDETMEDIYEAFCAKNPNQANTPAEGILVLQIEGVDGILVGFANQTNTTASEFGTWVQIKNIQPPESNSLGIIEYFVLPDPKVDLYPGEINTDRNRVEFGSQESRKDQHLQGYGFIKEIW